MVENMGKNGAILGGFAVATTALIVLTFFATDDVIQQQQQSKLRQTLNAVIPSELHDNDLSRDCVYLETTDNEEPKRAFRASINGVYDAAAIETTAPDGYSGAIELLVGIKMDGSISGVRVLSHKETPGLGDKIEESVSDWIYSFNNMQYSPENQARWAVKKDGGQFDQFTGATITPRAVVNAVAATADYFLTHREDIFAAENVCQQDTGNGENVDAD